MGRVDHILENVAWKIQKNAHNSSCHNSHWVPEHAGRFQVTGILAISVVQHNFLELMCQLPLSVREVFLVDGIALVFKCRCLISVSLKVVEVQSVHFLIRQAISFLDSTSVLIHHPVESAKDILIVNPCTLGVSDEWAAIVANLIGDVVVVETEDRYELGPAWERVKTELFVQCISVSDLEGR